MEFLSEIILELFTSNKVVKRIKVYLRSMRFEEVILIGGVTFIGLIFNTYSLNTEIFFKWFIAMLSSYSLLSHSFLSNDWSGYEYDLKDVNKKNRPLIKGEITLTEIKILCILMLLISLLLALYLSIYTFLMAAGVAVLNYFYSGNKIFLKSVPVISSLIHGIGATLGFLLGYTFEGGLNSEGFLFGFYFGIIYAAGHLNHEISDFESDLKSGIPTNPNRFGKKNAFIASFILFSISFLYIFILSLSGILPSLLSFGVILFYVPYLFYFIRTFKSDMDYKSMISFRRRYRIIFLLWGIFIAAVIVYKNFNPQV